MDDHEYRQEAGTIPSKGKNVEKDLKNLNKAEIDSHFEKIAKLTKLIGGSAMQFIQDHPEWELHVGSHIGGTYQEFVLIGYDRVTYLICNESEFNEEYESLEINFAYLDDVGADGVDYESTLQDLQKQSVVFLRLLREFLRSIDISCPVLITPAGLRRRDFWSKVINKLQDEGYSNIVLKPSIDMAEIIASVAEEDGSTTSE